MWNLLWIQLVLAHVEEKPKTNIDFEQGEVMETMNQKNLDALAAYEDKELFSRHKHLYDKKLDFYLENNSLMKELRFVP